MGSFLDWFLPPGASSFAAEIDRIYYLSGQPRPAAHEQEGEPRVVA